MRNLIAILLFLLPLSSIGQSIQYQGTTTTLVKNRGGIGADSIMQIPVRDTTKWLNSYGNLTIRPQDNSVWYRANGIWQQIGSGGSINNVFTGTLSQSRALTSTPELIVTTDYGGGTWFKNDTVTVDNTGTQIITAGGQGYSRILDGYVMPEWWGAKGNGSEDDFTPIVNSMNIGLPVLLSNKSYSFSEPINMPKRTTILGSEKSTLISLTDSATLIVDSMVSISKVRFIGTATRAISNPAVGYNVYGVTIDKCYFEGLPFGIYLERGTFSFACTNYNITNNEFKGCNYGIYAIRMNRSLVKGNVFNASTSRNIEFNGGSNNIISNNVIDGGITGVCFIFHLGIGSVMENNTIENNTITNVSEESISFDVRGNTAEIMATREQSYVTDKGFAGGNYYITLKNSALLYSSNQVFLRGSLMPFTGQGVGSAMKILSYGLGSDTTTVRFNLQTTADVHAKIAIGDTVIIGFPFFGNIVQGNNIVCPAISNATGIYLYGLCYNNTVTSNSVRHLYNLGTAKGICVQSLNGLNSTGSITNPPNGRKAPSHYNTLSANTLKGCVLEMSYLGFGSTSSNFYYQSLGNTATGNVIEGKLIYNNNSVRLTTNSALAGIVKGLNGILLDQDSAGSFRDSLAIHQDGDAFSDTISIGSLDNNPLVLKTNNINRFTIGTNSMTTNIGSFINSLSIVTNSDGSILPTHSFTIPSVGTGFVSYNTSDQTTNYERFRQYWSGNTFNIMSEIAGTGINRTIQIGQAGAVIGVQSGGQTFAIRNTNVIGDHQFFVGGTLNNASGLIQNAASVPTINQTGSAGYRSLFISPFEQSTGSGAKLLIDAGTNSAANGRGTHTSKFSVDNLGRVTQTTDTYTSGGKDFIVKNRTNGRDEIFSGDSIYTKSQTDSAIAVGGNFLPKTFSSAQTVNTKGFSLDIANVDGSGNGHIYFSANEGRGTSILLQDTSAYISAENVYFDGMSGDSTYAGLDSDGKLIRMTKPTISSVDTTIKINYTTTNSTTTTVASIPIPSGSVWDIQARVVAASSASEAAKFLKTAIVGSSAGTVSLLDGGLVDIIADMQSSGMTMTNFDLVPSGGTLQVRVTGISAAVNWKIYLTINTLP